MTVWRPEEEQYLRELSALCATLSIRFREEYLRYKALESRFQIPAIIVSSAIGVSSFGANQFGEAAPKINLAVGVVGICLGILNSVQSYLRIGPTMAGSLLASVSLSKLKETIDLELALPIPDRSASGIMFLREAVSNHEKIMDAAPPVLKRPRFVRAPDNDRLSSSPSVPIGEGLVAVQINPLPLVRNAAQAQTSP